MTSQPHSDLILQIEHRIPDDAPLSGRSRRAVAYAAYHVTNASNADLNTAIGLPAHYLRVLRELGTKDAAQDHECQAAPTLREMLEILTPAESPVDISFRHEDAWISVEFDTPTPGLSDNL